MLLGDVQSARSEIYARADLWCALDVIKQTDFHHLMIIFTQGDGEQPTYPLRSLSLSQRKSCVCISMCNQSARVPRQPRIVLMQSDIEDEQSRIFDTL
jgi:hypothetical protein